MLECEWQQIVECLPESIRQWQHKRAPPRCLWPDEDILGPLVRVYHKLAVEMGRNGLPPFLVPDVKVHRGKPLSQDAVWLQRPMSYNKFEN